MKVMVDVCWACGGTAFTGHSVWNCPYYNVTTVGRLSIHTRQEKP